MKRLRNDRLLAEAIIVGISAVIMGIIVTYLMRAISPDSVTVPTVCKTWNKHHVMEISLFFTGFFLHVAYELSGANQWYCISRSNYA
jgi:hypothetical protein